MKHLEQLFGIFILVFLNYDLSQGEASDTNNSLVQEVNPSPSEGQGQGIWKTLDGNRPNLIAHRGEKVLMPEHTLGSYEIASIEQADFIETDLILTKDGHLVCHHDLTLKESTNIEDISELAHLIQNYTGVIDEGGQLVRIINDWLIPNLTLAQIRLLRVKQARIGIRPQYFNDLFQIPTLQEFLDLIHEISLKMNGSIGIMPELKHPEFLNRGWGRDHYVEDLLLTTLENYGYPVMVNARGRVKVNPGPVVIQSFSVPTLQYLSQRSRIPLMVLIFNDPYLLTPRGLAFLSKFVSHYSIWKEFLVSRTRSILSKMEIPINETFVHQNGGFIKSEEFPGRVHELGLRLSIYTIVDSHERSRRGCGDKCLPEDKRDELFYYFSLGVDDLFVENLKEAAELRMEYELSRNE